MRWIPASEAIINTEQYGQQLLESLFVVLAEPTNTIDQYAVAVIRSGLVVGHLPKKISRVCSLFLRRGGTIINIV